MIGLLSWVAGVAAAAAIVIVARDERRGSFRGWLAPVVRGPSSVDHFIGLALTCAYVAIVLKTAPSLGFMRDEGMYFDASKSYAGWFEKLLSKEPTVAASAFVRSTVDSAWSANSEHPSLIKSSFALSWLYLFRSWPQGLIELFHRHALTTPLSWLVAGIARMCPKLFTEESASFRFPGMVTGGLTLWITYVFGAEVRGRAVGLVAAILFAALPRTFFDAHLAAFDAAATLAWLAVAYAYWKGLASARWAVLSGFVWGAALLTKHNSWFLPLVFAVHYAWLAYDVLRARKCAPPTLSLRLRTLTIPWPFLFMGMIGPALFVFGWPHLWFDTWARIDGYFSFHAHHDYYNIEYLHRTYFQPPMPISMPTVLVLATVPTTTLVACAIGLWSKRRAIFAALLPAEMTEIDDPRRTSFFWAMNLALPIALISHPKVPHFGGTKHWHPAYPFLCLFAGAGVVLITRKIVAITRTVRWHRAVGRVVAFLVVALSIAPAIVETKRSHPHGLSHYVPLVGGVAGAADLGLNRGFWGYETGALTDWLNTHLPHGGRVYPNDTYYSSFEQLKADGRLRPDILQEWGNVASCDVAVVEHEQHMDEVEAQIWMAFGTTTPAYVVTLDGVPTLTVYVNPKSTHFTP